MQSDPIRSYLEGALAEYLADLHELVSIDSGSHNKAGVDAVAGEMEYRLRASGCEVQRLPNDVYGDSLVARLQGDGDSKIVMVGHMDTVYPDGTAAERPFYIEGDYAHGPGAADMKGGVLAGLYAIRALRQAGARGFGEVVLFLNPDEEIGSPSSTEAIDRECEGATAALVLEGALEDGSLVVGRKGVYDYTLTVHGRSAHAGVEPEKGRSAIHEIAEKIVRIASLDGLSEGTTVNVGTVRGGTRPNVVADLATCEVDVRVRTLAAREELERRLEQIVSEPFVPDTRIELASRNCFPPMERNERNEHLLDRARSVASSLGLELGGAESGGGSDANHISAAGTPVLDGLGPLGFGKHSPEERLYIPSVVERTALLTHLLLDLATGPAAS